MGKGIGGREREVWDKAEDVLDWLTRSLGSDARRRVGVGRRDEEADVLVEEDSRSDLTESPSGSRFALEIDDELDPVIEADGLAGLVGSLAILAGGASTLIRSSALLTGDVMVLISVRTALSVFTKSHRVCDSDWVLDTVGGEGGGVSRPRVVDSE